MLPDVLKSGQRVVMSADPRSETALLRLDGSSQGQKLEDVIFPVIHGTFGEDRHDSGIAQELAGLPFVGAGVLQAARLEWIKM